MQYGSNAVVGFTAKLGIKLISKVLHEEESSSEPGSEDEEEEEEEPGNRERMLNRMRNLRDEAKDVLEIQKAKLKSFF